MKVCCFTLLFFFTSFKALTQHAILNPATYPVDELKSASNHRSQQLVVNFQFSPDSTCSGTSIQFTPDPISGGTAPFTYHWKLGDGYNSNSPILVHIFNQIGCGTATLMDTLIVTDANNISDTVVHSIRILRVPDVQLMDQDPFAAPAFSNCVKQPSPANPSFTLTVKNISANINCTSGYTIDWGDNSGPPQSFLPTSFIVPHTYTSLGAFNLIITATGTNGCTNRKIYKVFNQSNPAAGIRGPDSGSTRGCAPLGFWFYVNYVYNSPGTSFTWNFGDGSPNVFWETALSGDSIFHVFNTTSCGQPLNQFTVTVTAKNGCDSTSATVNGIKIYKKPVAKFDLPLTACTNQAVAFTNNSIQAYNEGSCSRTTVYNWNFGDPVSGQNNYSTATSPSHIFSVPGTYTITLIATGSCGSDTIVKQICITAPPITSFTLDTVNICSTNIVTVTNTSVSGTCPPTGYKWTVAYTSGFCGTSSSWAFTNNTNDSSANPSFLFNNPGTYTITLKISGPCNTPGFSKTVTVKKRPSITLPSISDSCHPVTICPVPIIATCGEPILSSHWLFDAGAAGSSDSLNPGCIFFSSVGIHSIYLSLSNRCGTTDWSDTFQIREGPQLLNFPSKDTFYFCPGQTAGPFLFPTNPPRPATSVTWLNNNTNIGLTTAGGNDSIKAFTTANTTNLPITARITVTATFNNCITKDTFYITVYPKPPVPTTVTTPVTYCKDSAASPLSNAVTITPGYTLHWYTTATGGTGSTTAPTPATNNTGNFTYYVSQVFTATGCESNRDTLVVMVRPVPVITGNSFINPDSCGAARGSITLTGLTPNTYYVVRYFRNNILVSPLPAIQANASGILTIPTLTAGMYTVVTVTPSPGGCTSAAVGPFQLTDPNAPPTPVPIAGTNPLCQGDTLRLSITPPLPAGASYVWTNPANLPFSNLLNPQINNIAPADGGTYAVIVTVNSCPSLPGSINITVHPNPAAPSPTGNSPVCSGDTVKLFSNTSASGISHRWSSPSGFVSNLSNPVIPNATAATAGNYIVVVTNTSTNCHSPAGTTLVVVKPTPHITGYNFTIPTGCLANNGTITLSGLTPSTTYTVFYTKDNMPPPITHSLPSDTSGNIRIEGLFDGTYSNIYVSLNNCISNAVGPVTLAYIPPFTAMASNNSPLCDGDALQLFASPSSSAPVSYTWQGPGLNSSLQNPVINNATILNNGVYYLTVNINGCIKTDSTLVTVSSRSAGGDTYNDSVVCMGTNTGTVHLRANYGSVLRWESSSDNGITWNPLQNTAAAHTYTNLIATTLYRAAVKSGVCPVAYSDTTKITVVNTVSSVKILPDSVSTCNHDTSITFTGSAIYMGIGPVSYSWYVNGSMITGNANPFTYPFRTATNNRQPVRFPITLLVRSPFGCADSFTTGVVVIKPLPGTAIKVSPSTIQNEPNYLFTFEDNLPADSNKMYTWYMGDRGAHIRSGKQISFEYEGPGTYKVILLVTDRVTGCVSTDSVKVTVLTVPGLLFVPNAFYPNSSGNKLRTFKPEGIGLETYLFQVFDNWGRLLFETSELNPDGSPKQAWDGTDTRTGKPMPQDAYGWRITAKFKNGKTWDGMSYKGGSPKTFGTITLFR